MNTRKHLPSYFLLLLSVLSQPVFSVTPLDRGDLQALFGSFDTTMDGGDSENIAGFSGRALFLPNVPPDPAVKDNGVTADLLLRMIKRSPYDYGFDRRGRILAQRGTKVHPALVEALKGADGYFRICLIHILGATPSSERDAAFVAQLEKLATEKKDFLRDNTVEPLIQTLAASNVQEAVPVLKQLLKREDIHNATRAEIRVALVQLGALELTAMEAPHIEIDPNATNDKNPLHLALLEALLKYGLLEHPIQFNQIKPLEDGYIQLDGKLDDGTWYLKFGAEQSGRIPLYYSWYRGALNAAGYYGVLEQVKGQWLVTFWRMIWIA